MNSLRPETNASAAETISNYVQVVDLLWQLGAKSNYDQFMMEAQAIWMDIFSKQPDRISMLLDQLKEQRSTQSETNSPPQPEETVCVTPAGYSIQSDVTTTVIPPSTSVSPPILTEPFMVNQSSQHSQEDLSRFLFEHFHRQNVEQRINLNCYDGYMHDDKCLIDFLQVCSLDRSSLLHICTVFPKLREELLEIARLWDRYESTKYSYASTKKWTWKRSKLTEGTEMVHDGLLEVKMRLDGLCKRFAVPHNGDLSISQASVYDYGMVTCLQQSQKALTFLKNILTDVTNRLQKRNQMQRSQELAQERLRIAESEFKKQSCCEDASPNVTHTDLISQSQQQAPLF